MHDESGKSVRSLPSRGAAVKEFCWNTNEYFVHVNPLYGTVFRFLSLGESMLQTRGSHSSLRQSHLKSETGQRRKKNYQLDFSGKMFCLKKMAATRQVRFIGTSSFFFF